MNKQSQVLDKYLQNNFFKDSTMKMMPIKAAKLSSVNLNISTKERK